MPDDKKKKKEPEAEEKTVIQELDGEALEALVAKVLEEKLTPITESVTDLRTKALEVERKQPSIVGGMGPPDTKGQGAGDEKSPIVYSPQMKDFPKDIIKEYSLSKAIMAMVHKDWSMCPLEKEVSDAVQKTLTWASGSGGGLWVPEEFLGALFVEMLAAQQVLATAPGIMNLTPTGAPLLIPRQSAGTTSSWVGQNATQTATDVTPQQITMTPKVGMSRSSVSKLMAMTGGPATEQLIRKDLAEGVGRLIDLAGFSGTGTNNQPTGMANQTNVNSVAMGTNGAAITSVDTLYDMLYELELDNVPTNNLAWFMHPRTRNDLRQLKVASEANHYAFQPDVTQANRGTMLGYPAFTTTQITIAGTKGTGSALSELYLVALDEVILARWGVLRVEATDVGGTNTFENDLIAIKCVAFVDWSMRHDESCCLITDIVAG